MPMPPPPPRPLLEDAAPEPSYENLLRLLLPAAFELAAARFFATPPPPLPLVLAPELLRLEEARPPRLPGPPLALPAEERREVPPLPLFATGAGGGGIALAAA